MEILTWGLLILLLIILSVKIRGLGKRVKKLERFEEKVSRRYKEEMINDMFKSLEELLKITELKEEKNEPIKKESATTSKGKHKN